MSILTTLASILALTYSSISLGCAHPISSAYSALQTAEGHLVFNETPFVVDNAGGVELGINVSFYNCADNSEYLIGELPFLATTGKIITAFFADANNDGNDELFVIHAAPINSDTGVNYHSDYYSTHVYEKTKNKYSRNEKISSYFGSGGDIINDADNDLLAYTFPYKTETSIREKLSSKNYLKWAHGEEATYTVNKKTYIHRFPVLPEKTHMYLVSGDAVTQVEAESGWISITFITRNKKEIHGWIKCEDVDGC
ncbi:hypothetical protein ACQKFS_08445 [Pseudomonas guineae]|uniref:hypothetical protein n=1 Tax=Pseudomonas guineae TaxID=425504 RepID=UPI003CFFB44E|tara:strand:+ start:2836 stop:3600 length:765 start_codon:yes stop_codon:yes gene_type:complete